LGTKRLLRDEHGWMIPKDGTLSRKIYGLLVQGKGTTEIASALGIKIANCRVLAHRIRNPEAVSAKRYNAHHYKAA
jgi:hypothetical protein